MSLRGINLGGWLIAERWMTPGLFEGVAHHGERAIGQELSSDIARARLESHRRSFITEADFEWIAAHGFNFIRLPVGYWLFEEDEGFISGDQYVADAFKWAERHKLRVLLDFHGLQGSQNGQDHSGEVGRVHLYKGDHQSRALATLDYLSKKYGHEPSLLGIELINEPKVRWFIYRLMRYYRRAYNIAQANVAPEVKIIVSDAFKPLRMSRALSRQNFGSQLVLDVHVYQLFSKQDQELSFEEHIAKIENDWRPLLRKVSSYVPVLVGEWSAALPAKAIGAENAEEKYQQYFLAQVKAFDEICWGESYWSYKAPGNGPWSYRDSSTLQRKAGK